MPEDNRETTTAFGGKLQTPQGLIIDLRKPAKHRTTNSRTQGLLDAPQDVGRILRTGDQEPADINIVLGECRRIRDMRWRHPGNPAPCRALGRKLWQAFAAQSCQRRHQQPQLTRTFRVEQ
jgi:hypothetical protein